MAGTSEGRSLEQTPTWVVAAVCFALVTFSILIEYIIHLIGQWLKKRHKKALYESLEKIKSELMLLGFISLMLTVGQGPISDICISPKAAATWHPCSMKQEENKYPLGEGGRKLLTADHHPIRTLEAAAAGAAAYETDKCAQKGKVAFVSSSGIHQLHIFIFVLAVFHVLNCILTMVLGRAKMKSWNAWEKETRTTEYQFAHDPERFRFARETSFGRRHLNFWSKSPLLLWIVCFFRQFVMSVPKVDYLTLRHGFIMAHLAPQSHADFDFQKYINRSLEEDFKVVVEISPPIWFFAVLFLLFNTHGWFSYLWLPFVPLIITLLVGTKLQVIITKMGVRIEERGDVVKGIPLVQPGDHLFWFNRPRLILYLINFVLFQNAFQLAFFAWTCYEFGLKSCFHDRVEDIVIRISMGYVTLPLYALVTQMGSTMKPTIFDERVAAALRNWHHTAKKQVKQTNKLLNSASAPGTPMSSRPTTPRSHGMSPIHLRGGATHYQSEIDSPQKSHFHVDHWDSESQSSTRFHGQAGGDAFSDNIELELDHMDHEPSSSQMAPMPTLAPKQHEIAVGGSQDFSFGKTIEI